MHRIPRYWSTTFGSWMGAHGVTRLHVELGQRGLPTTSQAIQHWLAGRTAPTMQRGMAIVEISAGALRLEDVYRHREELANPHSRNARRDSA